MHMNYDLERPDSLEEALASLANREGAVEALAGGTNLIADLRFGRATPDRLVSLDKLSGLRGIRKSKTGFNLGSRTTVSDILHSSEMASATPSLVQAAHVFAGQMVRNAATIAGNIACGSPAADLVPPLLSLNAEITLANAKDSRIVLLDEYYDGYKSDIRADDELITNIFIPALPEKSVNSFYKLARRHGDAITITGVAITIEAENGKCSRARIALGSVGPTVFRAKKAESMLEGEALTPALIEAAAKEAANESNPIDDVRASAEYRLHTVHTLTRRLVTQAWDKLG